MNHMSCFVQTSTWFGSPQIALATGGLRRTLRHSRKGSSLRRAPRALGAVLAMAVATVWTGVHASTSAADPPALMTFADEDRSSDLSGQAAHQRYQFNSPTTVTYDRDTLGGSGSAARVYVADMGNTAVRVLDLDGRLIGSLTSSGATVDPSSPHASAPTIKAPLGIAYLSASEADDPRLAGLYVNDVGSHQIHFYRTNPGDPNDFRYVTSIGVPGHGGGEQLQVPRNVAVLPQGLVYVADEFNHRIKGFLIDPSTLAVSHVATAGWRDANGRHVGAGPILPGQDKAWGSDSTHYDDYSDSPDKIEGFRIPQGLTWWKSGPRTFLYVADNGNNRIKIFEVGSSGALTLVDIISRFVKDGTADHLKRPRGIRVDPAGNLFLADTYGGRILRIDNLGTPGGPPRYRANSSTDVQARWSFGHLGIHQVDMRTPVTAALEDSTLQLPNDAVPLLRPDGSRYTESIYAFGSYFAEAPVVLVSDTGNHRIKKCWEAPSGDSILRCSVSAGVGAATAHEFWGHPRTLQGQLHYASALVELPARGTQAKQILVSDTPNSLIESYSAEGAYLGRFTGGQLMYGVTGLASFRTGASGDDRRVAALVAGDVGLPWPYTGDSSLRLYTAAGNLSTTLNLTYRTTGHGVPKISFTGGNMPIAVDVAAESSGRFGVFITTSQNYLWRFTWNRSTNSLTSDWVKGGVDPTKGQDSQDYWSLGPNFYGEGAAGTFDQIQGVAAGGGRVYAVDRRNQRINVFAASTGQYIGKIGRGGGTYDHPDTITATDLFLPHGVDLDPSTGDLLVGDGFNFVVRRYANPSTLASNSSGQITPQFLGHWLDPSLGTLDGGLFATQNVLFSGTHIYTDSLISNRITRFSNTSIVTP